MLSHDQMMNHSGWQSGDRGLRYFGRGICRDAAAAAARAAFELCDGKTTEWRGWAHPSGKMIKLAQTMIASFLDDDPNASTEECYDYISNFPCDGEKIPFGSGTIWRDEPVPWDKAPAAAQAAYEAYRHVYLQLWLIARTHHETVARAASSRLQLVQEAAPSNVVRFPRGDGAER